MRKDLPMELLRTYVTVFDLGGFTRAAEALGRTQPAISLQMRRLEEIVNAKLITYVGRKLKLTEEGEFFMVYARQILCLNDEALVRVSRNDQPERCCGRSLCRLADGPRGRLLSKRANTISREHPEVDLEIRCELSGELLKELNKGRVGCGHCHDG